MHPIEWCRKENRMTVVLMTEHDNPKDEERNNKKRKFGTEVMRPYWEKLVEEKGIKSEGGNWSDNTGHIIGWYKFETMEDFSKMWDDERWQQMMARWTHFVDNASTRLLRPGLTVPEDLFK